jgi:hypothetical protein
MKHIKTPVTCQIEWGYEMLWEPGGSELARVHIDRANAKETAREIRNALNAHDALVEALESQMRWKRHTDTCVLCGIGLECKTYKLMEREADELTVAALAKVRGEAE